MNKILQNLERPDELEKWFREDKNRFKKEFEEAYLKEPDSETIRVWQARLNFTELGMKKDKGKGLIWMGCLSLIVFILTKLPAFIDLEEEWYYPRFVPFFVLGSLLVYFLKDIQHYHLRRIIPWSFIGLFFILWMLPYDNDSDSLIMAQIYSPLVLLSLLGIAYAGIHWKDPLHRIAYLRYLGELLLLGTLILIGGMVLTGITFALFELIGLSIEEWYFQYVVIWGLVSAPIVATYLYDVVLSRKSNLATLLSNLFSPLFLITIVGYLIAIFVEGKSPYADRDFLITFNGLLLVVWGITVFSIAGRSKNNRLIVLTDFVNISLISVTLLINGIALSAIVYRFIEFGATPNRVSVTGANLLIFIHLVLILTRYIKEWKSDDLDFKLLSVITRYLPVYTLWSFFVVAFLPLIFKFA